jgi:ribokinase
METRLLARVGADADGLDDFLASYDVGTDLISVDPGQPTGHAIIQLDPDGHNCIIILSGANRAHDRRDLESALDGHGPGDLVLVQNETNGVPTFVEAAKVRGLTVAYNPSPVDEGSAAVDLGLVDFLFVNEHEAMALTGTSDTEAALDVLASRLETTGIVLTLGDQGSVFRRGTLEYRSPATQASVVDTTAAGDTFTGFFLATILRDGTPEHALDVAGRAAAIAVGRPGAAQSIPDRREVDGA